MNGYREDDHDSAYDGPTFPASVQRTLDQANALLARGQTAPAQSAFQQAGLELARSSPDIFAAMVAAQLGGGGVTFEDTTLTSRTEREDHRLFGVRVGHTERTVTDAVTKRRTIRLS